MNFLVYDCYGNKPEACKDTADCHRLAGSESLIINVKKMIVFWLMDYL